MKSLLMLILPMALATGGMLRLAAQPHDSGYVTSEELEPGYGNVYHSPFTQYIEEPQHRLFGVSVSPDGRWLAYNPEEGSTLRDLRSGAIVAFRSFGHRVQWSRDSRILKHTDAQPGRAFWNVETGERRVLTGPTDPTICSVYDVWAPDDNIYFENCYGDSSDGTSMWRILLDSSLKVQHPVYQPISKSQDIPYFPPNITSWYITNASMDGVGGRTAGFNIVHNFDWDRRRTVRIPVPDTNWYFSTANAWGQSSTFVPRMTVGPDGVVYLWLSCRAISESTHENAPPFTDEELRARNASGWYRVDTNGQGFVQLVRSWSSGLGISVTADGEKIYYGHLLPDTTCAVFEMDKWGRNKRQVSTPWEGLAFSGVSEQSGEKRSSAAGITVRTRRAGNRVAVHYRMNRPGPAAVTLYDLLGRPVAEQRHHAPGGPHEEMTMLLELPELPDGMYLVIVRSQNAVGNSRFVYTR